MTLRDNEVLLPVSPSFIWLSLIVAQVFNMLPWGRWAGVPDLVAVVLVFWNVHQPRLVGVGAAFLFGLLMDVHQGALLGQHALSYSLLSYLAITVHRRLLWFSPVSQALHIVPLFLVAHGVSVLVRLLAGAGLPEWSAVVAPLAESLLWPAVSFLLLVPQRRAHDHDHNRPL